jgi:hypothetical protein
MAPHTQTTTFRHLQSHGELGTILLRLMMFVNDLSVCNDSLEQWHKYEDEPHKKRSAGAKMYFVRLMAAHIYEALKVVHQINSKGKLRNAVGQCDKKTQELFKKVASLTGGEQSRKMRGVRNNITFHYLHSKIDTALATVARKLPDNDLPLSIGQQTIDWHFEPSDRVIDNAVLQEIFEVPEDANPAAEIEKVIEEIQSIGDDLAAFAGQFIFHYAK